MRRTVGTVPSSSDVRVASVCVASKMRTAPKLEPMATTTSGSTVQNTSRGIYPLAPTQARGTLSMPIEMVNWMVSRSSRTSAGKRMS